MDQHGRLTWSAPFSHQGPAWYLMAIAEREQSKHYKEHTKQDYDASIREVHTFVK